jgi:hypothetical protein
LNIRKLEMFPRCAGKQPYRQKDHNKKDGSARVEFA